jgi:predicted enzyme related to lactoylglutathione lyase
MNIKRAKDFYTKVFGWTFQDFGKDYTSFTPPGGGPGGGGIFKVKVMPKKPVIRAYIEVADIDTKLAEIKKARGKVLQAKTPISPEMGSWAQFADNQGTVLSLWQKG